MYCRVGHILLTCKHVIAKNKNDDVSNLFKCQRIEDFLAHGDKPFNTQITRTDDRKF